LLIKNKITYILVKILYLLINDIMPSVNDNVINLVSVDKEKNNDDK